MTDNGSARKHQKRRRKRAPKEQRVHNEALQSILNELPFGPVPFSKSDTHKRWCNHSVNSPDYPLMQPPFEIRIKSIQTHHWQWDTRPLYAGKRFGPASHIPLSYIYDLANQRSCTPLYTKGTIESITISLYSDILFCSYKSLTVYGSRAVTNCSHQYSERYA